MNIIKVTKENVDYHYIYEMNKEDNVSLKFNGIRVIDKKHVKKIVKDIIDGNVKCMAPIEVNINNFGVMDGQHRLAAAQTAWEQGIDFTLEVIFRDLPIEEESDVVVKKNTSQKSWNQKDFKHKLLVEGNESAGRLNDFCLSHDLLHGKKPKSDGTFATKDRYAMAFLRGANITKELLNGSVKIDDDDVETGEQLYKEVEILYNRLGFLQTAGWFEYFIQGWYEFRTNNKYCKRIERFGLEKYYDMAAKTFDKEKMMSKQVYLERFVGVLQDLEKTR